MTPTFCRACGTIHVPQCLVTCDGCRRAICPESARCESGWHVVERLGRLRFCGRIHRSDVRGDLIAAGRE